MKLTPTEHYDDGPDEAPDYAASGPLDDGVRREPRIRGLTVGAR